MPRNMAVGTGARRHRDRPQHPTRLRRWTVMFGARRDAPSSRTATPSRSRCCRADLVIGGVLIPGAAAPKLVTARHARGDEAGLGARRRRHRPGRLLRDLASDHPCRSHLRGRRRRPLLRRQHAGRACRAPRPSRSTTRRCRSCWRWPTRAGGRRCGDDPHLRNGLNVASGKVTCLEVANDLNYEYFPPQSVLAA